MKTYLRKQSDLQVDISWEHQMIHEGKTYFASYLFAGVATANKYVALLPIAQNVHMRNISLSVSDGSVELELLENPVLNANGTAILSHRLNRVDPLQNEANLYLYHTPNVASYGNTFYNQSVYAAKKSGTVADDEVEEFILASDRKYLVNVAHFGNAANVRISFTWYEPTHV